MPEVLRPALSEVTPDKVRLRFKNRSPPSFSPSVAGIVVGTVFAVTGLVMMAFWPALGVALLLAGPMAAPMVGSEVEALTPRGVEVLVSGPNLVVTSRTSTGRSWRLTIRLADIREVDVVEGGVVLHMPPDDIEVIRIPSEPLEALEALGALIDRAAAAARATGG